MGERTGGIVWLVLIAVGAVVGTEAFLLRCGPPGGPPCLETLTFAGLGLLLIVAGLLLAYFGEKPTSVSPPRADD